MVVVHVLNSLMVGGLEKVVVNTCNNLSNSTGYKIYIITLSGEHLDLQTELDEKVTVISLPYKDVSFLNFLERWFFGVPKMIKILRNMKPQIVHSHLYFQYFLFISICLKLSKVKAKHFRTIHTSGLFYSSKTLINKFRLSVESVASKIFPPNIISISKVIYDNNETHFNYRKKYNNKLIPNGIDLSKFSKESYSNIDDFFLKIDKSKKIVTYVSRLDVGKDHLCLLHSWIRVVETDPSAILCLLGDGVLKDELVEFVNINQINENVLFLGTTNKVAEILSITDVAVFPSQFEGFPLSLLEKMSMSLPVVVSDIAVFKELINPNKNGLMFKMNNPEELSSSIIKLLGNEELRFFLGNNAKKTAEKYDIVDVVNETISYYEEEYYNN